ncbi:MAG: hypothetical protein QNL04_15340 [SAR324 cluster bacterium]|nr:hypothetical protein [SAR324 cluster bacterium]
MNKTIPKPTIKELQNIFAKAISDCPPPTLENLSPRKDCYLRVFEEFYVPFCRDMSVQVLRSTNSFIELADYTNWLDAWILFSWDFVKEEEAAATQALQKETTQKLDYLCKNLPHKQKALDELGHLLKNSDHSTQKTDDAEYVYYHTQFEKLEIEITELETEINKLQNVEPALKKHPKICKKSLPFCIFARGGYGRSELSFSSDIDIGYVLDIAHLSGIECLILQELIKRLEELFQGVPLDFASQYFELNEDLSRFKEIDSLHAMPSVLEGRRLIGDLNKLKALKLEFHAILPIEKMSRFLVKQQKDLIPSSNETFYLKEGFGGLRHLNYSLWLALIFYRPSSASSKTLLKLLGQEGFVSKTEQQNLTGALEYINNLRNFIGLWEYYQEDLTKIDFPSQHLGKEITLDYLQDTVSMAFLKLSSRFTTIDEMDRYRLYSIKKVSGLSEEITENLLNRRSYDELTSFRVIKHLGRNQVIYFALPGFEEPQDISFIHAVDFEAQIKEIFKSFTPIFELFLYLAKKGILLHPRILDAFCAQVPKLISKGKKLPQKLAQNFIKDLFTAEYAASAVKQMLEIASPLGFSGEHKSLLGILLPEVDKMRFLLRNLNVHDHPLCEHSLLALKQAEVESRKFKASEAQLWTFLNEDDLFALKFATFFHDVGKTNPYVDHEQHGPSLCTKMLMRLGWDENADVLNTIRLLVRHHQSVVRFSQLETHLDLGIVNFFELTDRSPRKLILLYLINISDFKSVNASLKDKAGNLEKFFEKTIDILIEYRTGKSEKPLSAIVEEFLDSKVNEIKDIVFYELILQSCILKSLDEFLLEPLKKINPETYKKLEPKSQILGRAIHFLALSELDKKSLEKHRQSFHQALKSCLTFDDASKLLTDLSPVLDWFFTATPNRYLLSTSPMAIARQVVEMQSYKLKEMQFTLLKGQKGEYDTLFFYSTKDVFIHAKIAFVLGQLGMNIELGKVNQVHYLDGRMGYVGFLEFSQKENASPIDISQFEHRIDQLILPSLDNSPKKSQEKTNIQTQFFIEPDKAYLVKETKDKGFERVKIEQRALKVSLYDSPFCYFKLMSALAHFKINPAQVTITTIGQQIIDYFYISANEQRILESSNFLQHLQNFLNSDISKEMTL